MSEESSRGGGRGRGASRGGAGRGRGGRGGHIDLSQGFELIAQDDETTVGSNDADAEAVSESGRGARGGRGRGGRAPRPRRPLKEVATPDFAAFQSLTQSHQSSVTSLNQQIDSYSTKIENGARALKSIRATIKQLDDELTIVRTAKSGHFAEYERLRHHIDALQSSVIQRRNNIESMKKDLPHHSVAECDNQLKVLEKQLNSRTLLPAQERAVIEQIKQLRTLRPKIADYEKKSKEVASGSTVDTTSFAAERDQSFNLGHEKKSEEEKAAKLVSEAKEKEKKLKNEIDGWIVQRRELLNQRQSLERVYLSRQDEHKAAESKYAEYMKEKEWRDNEDARRAQQQREFEERQARREWKVQQKAEREAWQRDWEVQKRREELERDPYEKEKITVDELIQYITNLSIKYKADIGNDNDSEDTGAVTSNFAALAEERAAAFGGKQVKTLSQPNKKEAMIPELVKSKDAAKKSKAKKAPRVLSHIPDVFKMFQEVGVSAPLLADDLAETKKQLKQKQQFYESAPRPSLGAPEPEPEPEAEAAAETGGYEDEEEEEVQVTRALSETETAS